MSESGEGSKPSTPSSSSTPASSSSSSSQIQVYARIRPSKSISPSHFAFDPYCHTLTVTLPSTSSTTPLHTDQSTRDYINNQKLTYPFTFHHLFPPSTSQEALFNTVGRQCVTHLLQGYNSTIFAYGQTGSGKTFTITGGAESYDDRGIIPRTLSLLFEEVEAPSRVSSPAGQWSLRVSYLEIYNEAGYDLLDRSADLSQLSQLPKVNLMEDSTGLLHLHGLTSHPITTCQQALELLFRGDTNRMICETPSNDASSRSHCIFTITLESRDPSSHTVRRSKLHLVDLAGSERIKKTQVTGRLFKEAAYINLSLHHLEQCIIALHQRSVSVGSGGGRGHVPYRNSMMTSVLRDSLGGNCKTYMIATLSGEMGHLEETMSTARFAARVGMIRNEVWVEEEEDVEGVMRRLRGEVKELKEEVRRLRGEEGVGRGEKLTDEDVNQCKEVIAKFIRQEDGEEDPVPLSHEEKVRTYLHLMKRLIRGHKSPEATPPTPGLEAEVQRLQAEVNAKDEEIARLTALMERRPSPPPHLTVGAGAGGASPVVAESAGVPAVDGEGRAVSDGAEFDLFRQSYRASAQLEARKEELKALISEAKALGEAINHSREVINHHKQRLQARRVQREMSADDDEARDAVDSEEQRLRASIEEEKREYRLRFDQLKAKKDQIEHVKATIEQTRRRMQTDYQHWKAQHSSPHPITSEGPPSPPQPPPSPAEEKELFVAQPSPLPSPVGRGALSRMMMGGGGGGQSAVSGSVTGVRSVRVPTTGNAQADADISRFYALRDQLLQQAAAIQGAVTAIQ